MPNPSNPLLDAALSYAAIGWPVVVVHACTMRDGKAVCSCQSGEDCSCQGKHPRLSGWQKKATTNETEIRKLWARWPDSNVGVKTGGLIVAVDIDPPHGEETLRILANGDLPPTVEMRTGKGRRLIYAVPDGVEREPETEIISDNDGGEALRFQGGTTGAQCIMPPSRHYSGRTYEWVEGRAPSEIEPAPMPGWLIEIMCGTKPETPVEPSPTAGMKFTYRDNGASFNTQSTWEEILGPAGWTKFGGQREGVELWTRPGKKGGTSATIGHYQAKDGTPALYVFSGNAAPLEARKCYDKFGAFARLYHHGDFQAAAEALRDRGYSTPKRETTPAASSSSPASKGSTPVAAAPQSGPPPRGISALELFSKEFPPPKWAIENLLPEGLTILGGRPKQGKSWLALQIGLAVAGGMDMNGRKVTTGEVLYLALEDTQRRLKGRLQSLLPGLGWKPPSAMSINTTWKRSHDGGLQHIGEWLEDRKRTARLVIVDTLAKFRKPSKSGSNSYEEDYEAVGSIKGLLDAYGVSGLIITHTRKMKAEDPFDELSGTLGISGAADTMWVLDRSRGANDAKLFVTGRDIQEGTIPITFAPTFWSLGEFEDGIDTAGRSGQGDKGESKVEQCVVWLKAFLKHSPAPSDEILKAATKVGFTLDILKKAKQRLGKSPGTGELWSRNYGAGNGPNADWWCGLGPPETWTRRPTAEPDQDE